MKQTNVCEKLSAVPGTEEVLSAGALPRQWIFKDEEEDRRLQP